MRRQAERIPAAAEVLESRLLLSTINWVNRGSAASDTDNFNSVFGSNASTARGVVDAAIDAWERVITDFKYLDPFSNTFDLKLSMADSGTGFGGAARTDFVWFGKPTASTVTILRGNDTDGDGVGDGAGWFLDPTPTEHSEFLGGIVNAFAGDAPPGSPAFGLRDLYTIVVTEMTHSVGITGTPFTFFQDPALITDTGITDDAEGGGVGRYFVFEGPSIDHLMTSNNGGSSGSDFGVAVHSAGVGGSNQPVNFNGKTFLGAEDVGNAIFERGRRYLVPNTMRLILQDAYGYDTRNPAQFGTFYAALNQTTGEVLVRGGTGASNDNITISVTDLPFVNQQLVNISVDVGNDVPGTGPFSGSQNLPAFVTTLPAAAISSIRIEAGGGNDTINVDEIVAGVPVTINAGSGIDTVNVGNGDIDTNILSDIDVDGGSGGFDVLNLRDGSDTGNDSYTITGTTFEKSGFSRLTYGGVEELLLEASDGNNTVNVLGVRGATQVTVNGRGGNDTFNVAGGDFDTNIDGRLFVNGGAGADALRISDGRDFGSDSYTITSQSFFKPGFGTGTLNFSSISTMRVDANRSSNTINVTQVISTMSLVVDGNDGNDTFIVAAGDFDTNIDGALTIDGGAGTDVLRVDDRFDFGGDSYQVTFTTFTKPSFGTGTLRYLSIADLRLEANGSANTISVRGLSGATSLVVRGNGGSDAFLIAGGDYDSNVFGDVFVDGGSGADVLNIDDRNDFGADSYTFTASSFTKSSSSARLTYSSISTVRLEANNADNTINLDTKSLTPAFDILARGGNDTVNGGVGHDRINGGDGNDVMFGNDGNDRFVGGRGFDRAFGGNGNDFADTTVEFFDGGPGIDGMTIFGTESNDDIRIGRMPGPQVVAEINGETIITDYANGEVIVVFAGAGNDRVVMQQSAGRPWRAEFHGEEGNDRLFGSVNHDLLNGGLGNDLLSGGAGNDILRGGAGSDRLDGGEGDDELAGGIGKDVYDGGQGTDIIFARDEEHDVIFADLDDLLDDLDPFDTVLLDRRRRRNRR